MQSRRHFPNAHFVSGSGERYGGRMKELARHMCVRSVLGPLTNFQPGRDRGGGGKRRGNPDCNRFWPEEEEEEAKE